MVLAVSKGENMVALLVLLLILALFGGLGFAVHFLWIVLIVAVILWLIGFFVGGAAGAAGAGLGLAIIEEIAGTPADEVTPEANFVDDLDIDSLSMVEIAVAAQDKFGVEIPDEQLKDLKTVQDVVNFVSKNS